MVPRPFKMSQVFIAVVSEYPLMEPVECPLSATTATLQLISVPGALPARYDGMAGHGGHQRPLQKTVQARWGEGARAGGRREVGQAVIAMGAKQVLMQSSKHKRECVTHCHQK